AKAPYANHEQVPRYEQELAPVNERGVYITPAHPLRYTFVWYTFKTGDEGYYSDTPKVSSNKPIYGRVKALDLGSTLKFYVLSKHEIVLPRWIRLGKSMAKVLVTIVDRKQVEIKEGPYHAPGALNPLDLVAIPDHCNMIDMPPAGLLTDVDFTGQYYAIA